MEQKQSYLQELHSVATPNKEIINKLRDLMTEIRKDQSLSEELHNFYDFYSSFGSTQLVHFNTNYANIHKTMQHKKLSHKAPSVRRRTRKPSGWFVKFVAVHGFE